MADLIEFHRPIKSLEDLVASIFEPVPDPEACPQCGSSHFVPIIYGYLSEEAEQRARKGEFACGGCTPEPERWCCKSCDHRWPAEWPKLRNRAPAQSDAERRAERIRRSWENYVRFAALAEKPPTFPGAFVERVLRRTTRPDDRSFRVRLPWDHAVVEKTTKLVNDGGAPEFSVRVPADWYDPPPDDAEREAEAVAVVLRHIKRHGDQPYRARERFRLHDTGG